MDHLFCSCVCHALILVPASLRDLHRHSCRHFHFSFLAFFAPSYPHFVSQWISFLSSPPPRARSFVYFVLTCSLPFSTFRASFFLFTSPFFLERAFSFLATQWNMRARVRHRERAVPRSSIFRESSSSLRPLWGVSSSETLGEREREDFLSSAPREIDELPRDRTERRKGNPTKKCKVSRAHSKHRKRLRSYARRAFKGSAAAVFIELAKANLLAAPKTGPPTTARPDQNRINNGINDLEKSLKNMCREKNAEKISGNVCS